MLILKPLLGLSSYDPEADGSSSDLKTRKRGEPFEKRGPKTQTGFKSSVAPKRRTSKNEAAQNSEKTNCDAFSNDSAEEMSLDDAAHDTELALSPESISQYSTSAYGAVTESQLSSPVYESSDYLARPFVHEATVQSYMSAQAQPAPTRNGFFNPPMPLQGSYGGFDDHIVNYLAMEPGNQKESDFISFLLQPTVMHCVHLIGLEPKVINAHESYTDRYNLIALQHRNWCRRYGFPPDEDELIGLTLLTEHSVAWNMPWDSQILGTPMYDWYILDLLKDLRKDATYVTGTAGY